MNSPTSLEFLRVLVADDDEDIRALVSSTLRADGCSTIEAGDGEELLELLRTSMDEPWLCPDVVVADVKMPKLSGLGVLAALQRARWKLPVIMMTVLSDDSIHRVAKRLGAVGVLRKPFEPSDLVNAVRSARAHPIADR